MLEWERQPDAVCVDSGAFTRVAYEFVRDAGSPFFVTKGADGQRFNAGRPSKDRIPGDNFYGSYQPRVYPDGFGTWLYMFNPDYWKTFVHQRFLTDVHDEAGAYNPGSLSLFNPGKKKEW